MGDTIGYARTHQCPTAGSGQSSPGPCPESVSPSSCFPGSSRTSPVAAARSVWVPGSASGSSPARDQRPPRRCPPRVRAAVREGKGRRRRRRRRGLRLRPRRQYRRPRRPRPPRGHGYRVDRRDPRRHRAGGRRTGRERRHRALGGRPGPGGGRRPRPDRTWSRCPGAGGPWLDPAPGEPGRDGLGRVRDRRRQHGPLPVARWGIPVDRSIPGAKPVPRRLLSHGQQSRNTFDRVSLPTHVLPPDPDPRRSAGDGASRLGEYNISLYGPSDRSDPLPITLAQ